MQPDGSNAGGRPSPKFEFRPEAGRLVPVKFGPCESKPTGRVYKILALTFAAMTVILMLLVNQQGQTIEQQKSLLRKMVSNKACMTGTGGNE